MKTIDLNEFSFLQDAVDTLAGIHMARYFKGKRSEKPFSYTRMQNEIVEKLDYIRRLYSYGVTDCCETLDLMIRAAYRNPEE